MSSTRLVASMLLALSLGCGQAQPPQDPPLQFSSAQLPVATAGQPYLAVIAVTNAITPISTVEVADGALPPGLQLQVVLPLETKEFQLSGTPPAAGSATFILRVRCYGTNHPGQLGEQTYTLTVLP